MNEIALLETVDGCSVTWREGGTAVTPGIPRSGRSGPVRRLNSVQIRRTTEKTFEFTRPRSGAVIVKRIGGKHVTVTDADGVDVIGRWLAVQRGPESLPLGRQLPWLFRCR